MDVPIVAKLLMCSILAQTTSAPADTLRIDSVWDFVVKGGPTMIPIVLVSLVALAVTVERLIVLRKKNIAPPEFLTGLDAVSRDRRRAMEFCKANGSPLANVLAAALRHWTDSSEKMDRAVEEAGYRELIRLRKHMRLMSALPQVSTMLGLLGTIFGMIKTFQSVAASGESIGKTEMLAKGIYEAWTTTASGLLVAIPVLVAYHVIMSRIDASVAELDRAAVDWVERQRGEARSPAASRSDSEALVEVPANALSQAPIAAS